MDGSFNSDIASYIGPIQTGFLMTIQKSYGGTGIFLGEIGRIYTHSDFHIPMYTPTILTFIFVTLFFDHCYNLSYLKSHLKYTHIHLCIL